MKAQKTQKEESALLFLPLVQRGKKKLCKWETAYKETIKSRLIYVRSI